MEKRFCIQCGGEFSVNRFQAVKKFCTKRCRVKAENNTRSDYKKEWYVNNKERISDYRKKYYQKNKDIMNRRSLLWVKTAKGRFARRRIRHYKSGVIRTSEDIKYEEWLTLLTQVNYTCPRCRKVFNYERFEVDMIIPLSKGGSLRKENVQPLCKTCNRQKFTKIERY